MAVRETTYTRCKTAQRLEDRAEQFRTGTVYEWTEQDDSSENSSSPTHTKKKWWMIIHTGTEASHPERNAASERSIHSRVGAKFPARGSSSERQRNIEGEENAQSPAWAKISGKWAGPVVEEGIRRKNSPHRLRRSIDLLGSSQNDKKACLRFSKR